MRHVALASCLFAVALGAAPASADRLQELRGVEDQSTVNLVTTGRKSGQPRTVTIWFVHDAGRITCSRKGRKDRLVSQRARQAE